ncbi:unnamed protein product, partial [Vitis vinifera]
MAMASCCGSYKEYDIRKRNPNPKNSVLLVIDMQNYFSSIAKPIIPAITTTIALCRRASIPVIFTRHSHKSPADHAMLGEGVEEVIVSGVMTNLCCETTAREAFVRGFRVFFSTDATATATAEMHEATLMNMAYGFAYLVDCDRLDTGLFGN